MPTELVGMSTTDSDASRPICSDIPPRLSIQKDQTREPYCTVGDDRGWSVRIYVPLSRAVGHQAIVSMEVRRV